MSVDKDNRGSLYLDSFLRTVDFLDGTSHTILLGEKQCSPDDLGWASGTRSTLRNAGTNINLTGPNGMRTGAPPAADEVTIVDADLIKQQPSPVAEEPVVETAEPADDENEWYFEPSAAGPLDNPIVATAPIDPMTYVGGFGSWHSGGVAVFGIADGSVRTFTEDISPLLFRRLANRADGQIEHLPE